MQQIRVTVDQNASPWNGGPQQTLVIREVCPRCTSAKDKKNGPRHNGQQPQHCHACGRQCVPGDEHDGVAAEQRALSACWLGARRSWRGMGRAVGGTLQWG